MCTRRGEGLNETEFQAEVMRLARTMGWMCRHFHDSRREVVRGGAKFMVGDKDAAGWPDLMMWHPTRGLVLAELKGPKTPVTPNQRATLESLAVTAMGMAAGGTGKFRVHLWRPNDMVEVVLPLLRNGQGPILYGV